MVIALAGINPWKDGYLQINIITWRKKLFFMLLRGIKSGHWAPLNKYRQSGTKWLFFFLFLQADKENSCGRKEEGLVNTPRWCCMPFAANVLWRSLTKVIKWSKKKAFAMPQLQDLGKNQVWTPWRLQTHLRATSHHLSHHCWGEWGHMARWGWRVFNVPELTTTDTRMKDSPD